MKLFRGKLNSLYKKWELYLYRLFCLGKWMQEEIRIQRITGPNYINVCDPYGYDGEMMRVPPNPFYLKEEDKEIFHLVYEHPIHLLKDTIEAVKYNQREVWRRIREVKLWLGITRNTRFIGEKKADTRLCEELEVFLQYPDNFPIHKIMFGDDDLALIRAFQNFLRDRRKHRGVQSFKKYF